jgi:hypothetical protein
MAADASTSPPPTGVTLTEARIRVLESEPCPAIIRQFMRAFAPASFPAAGL